jgi:hypothetical protein
MRALSAKGAALVETRHRRGHFGERAERREEDRIGKGRIG